MGIFRHGSMITVGLVFAILALATAANADVVTLRDGRVFEGRVLSQSGGLVEIDCVVHGVRSVLKFRRTEVRTVELKPLPSDFFGGDPDPAPSPRDKPSKPPAHDHADVPAGRPPAGRYAVLPLHGTFGEEIHADNVRKVLERARSTSNTIVIDIESNGGYIEEAKAVAEVLHAFDEDFEYIALVREALSAAVWPVLAADRILMLEDGTLGGAVGYFQERTTGSIEVDAKMNSVIAAELETQAQHKGWNSSLIRAMVILGHSVFAWKEDEQINFGETAPAHVHESWKVVGSDEILTISGPTALIIGFPEVVPASTTPQQLGSILAKGKRWTEGSRYGFVVADEANEHWLWFKEALANRDGIKRAINQHIKDALAADPDNQVYSWIWVNEWNELTDTYDQYRKPTQEAWSKWYGSTDRAIEAWKRVATNLELLARVDDAAEYYHRNRLFDFEEMKQHFDRAARETTRLRTNRERGPQR